ncbi:MAG: cytochrome P450 [Acidimicrobiia bacterium]|nr:cytochrome P450 [Acidimicrobiia bacterium]MDH5236659.1 cytochrome P450 [Acidimicrobiia bacterium]
MMDATEADTAADDLLAAQVALAEIFLTPAGNEDPYSRYRLLHERSPVTPSGDGGLVLVRYDDCQEVLRENRLGKNFDPTREIPGAGGHDPEILAYRRAMAERRRDAPLSMLAANPPDHTRIRSLVSRAFTPRRVEQMRSHIVDLAEECFDQMAEARELDLLEALGFPLPVSVIGELVGVPRADWGRFRRLISASAAALEAAATIAELEDAEAATTEVFAYFADLVAQKRQHPGDDLLSGMIEASDGGDRLTEGEVIVQAVLMFAAGFETTTNLIGNGVVALLTHPDQMAALWADPALVVPAVEEILRFDSPVQLDARTTNEAMDVAGVAVDEGARIITLLGAANRDPTRFDDPDVFDIGRDQGPPLSFASGIHYCLGANLARAEGQVVLDGLVRRFSRIELTGELVHRHRVTLRGYEAVPVRVTPN